MWRESLRDIEACLASNHQKLFHMGLSCVPARSALSDALNLRDWRIYHALAMRLIARARELYVKEPMGIELDATVYALDSTTIDLCLNLFDWAPFRSTKAAVKMHTLLDLCGNIPSFIHISDGKVGDVNVLRHFAYRTRRILRDGSGISGFCQTVQPRPTEPLGCFAIRLSP